MSPAEPGFFSERFAEFKLDSKIERAGREAAWLCTLLPAAPHVLDLGCGRGRVAIALAGLGAHVVGLDQNADYLEVARKRAEIAGVPVTWRCGRDLDLADVDAFDGAISMFTSFGYHDDVDSRAVLRRIRRALRPGGILVIETQNRDDPGVLSTSASVERIDDHTEILKEYEFDVTSSRKKMKFRYLVAGTVVDGGMLEVRLFSAHELMLWLAADGFEVRSLYGSSRGDEFRPTGEKLVVVARKVDA